MLLCCWPDAILALTTCPSTRTEMRGVPCSIISIGRLVAAGQGGVPGRQPCGLNSMARRAGMSMPTSSPRSRLAAGMPSKSIVSPAGGNICRTARLRPPQSRVPIVRLRTSTFCA
jgi:hypothetical protein